MTAEEEAHELYDAIYGPLPEASWEQVKQNWIDDLKWLREQIEKLP